MVALVVADLLEVHRAPLELAERIVEIAVDRTRVHHRHAGGGQGGLVVRLGFVEEVRLQGHMDARIVDHTLHPRGVPVDRQTLPRVHEIPVVIVETHRQTVDDARGQVLRIGLPLLARVVLDERLVQRTPDQRDALVVEVLRVGTGQFAGLSGDQGLGLGRRVVRAEELVDGPQIDRQRVHLTVVGRVHAVHVVGEGGEPVHIIPHAPVGRVEQVGAVLVDLRAGLLVHVAVRVAADMVAHVDDLHPHAEMLDGLLGHGQAEQARAHDHQIRILHLLSHKNNPPNGLQTHITRVRFHAHSTHAYALRVFQRTTSTENSHVWPLVRAWCTLVLASAWRYVTQLPQGRNAARVSGLFRVRGGFSYMRPDMSGCVRSASK